MVFCNGSPKTGTHLLLKVVRMFGGRCVLAVHRHDVAIDSIEHQHIHIIRCPRNALISYLRMQNIEPLRSNIIKEMPRFIEEYQDYLHYLDDDNTLNVRFESLLSDPNELDKIAVFLNKPLVEDHFNNMVGGTATYNETSSNYKEFWLHSKISRKWIEFGGGMLEGKLGYTYD